MGIADLHSTPKTLHSKYMKLLLAGERSGAKGILKTASESLFGGWKVGLTITTNMMLQTWVRLELAETSPRVEKQQMRTQHLPMLHITEYFSAPCHSRRALSGDPQTTVTKLWKLHCRQGTGASWIHAAANSLVSDGSPQSLQSCSSQPRAVQEFTK